MASSVEATRAQLESIEKQLATLKKQASLSEPAIPLINASLDAVASFDEDVALPLQNLLHYLSQLKTILKSEEAQKHVTKARQGCIKLLIDMFSKNQQKLDSLQSGTSKLKEQYRSEFLESKEQLAQNYHQHKERPKAKTGYLGQLFQFFDFLEPLRRAEFTNALHAQTIKFYRQTQVADTSFNHAHLPEIMQLEIMQRVIQQTLMNEPTFNIGMLPRTSRSYQFFMKELVGRHQGIVIGNLAIDNNYEASRDWLTQINKVMKQPLQTYQFINEMDKFSASEQQRFERTSAPVFSTQPLQDKSVTPEEFKKLTTYDENFIGNLLTLLDTAYPQSAIVQFSNNKGDGIHSIAIAKDERGIWLHDPKQYCVYFPNKVLGSDEATQHFTAFFNDFHQRNYPNLTQVALVHLPENRPASENELSRRNKHEINEREQPLILGPGPGLNKQPTFDLEATSPKPRTKPKSDGPGRGPKTSY